MVCQLANALSSRGHEVAVAAGGNGKMWTLLNNDVERFPLLHLQRALSPTEDARALVELHRLYQHWHPDIIHLHSSKAGMLGRIVLPTRRIVYTVHGFDSIRLAYRKFLPIERVMQYRAAAIVGVSFYDKENLLREGIHRHVSAVYNGIATPEKPEARLLPHGGRPKVLTIARLSPPKNHILLFQVAERLPEVDFFWIGNQCAPPAHPANVHFLGNISEAGRHCCEADVFFLPSNYEGLPMVIIEAMAQGMPVVASNVGGVAEIVKNGQTGFALPNDAGLVVARLREILSDAAFRTTLGANARELYARELTVARMADGYEAVYRSLQ